MTFAWPHLLWALALPLFLALRRAGGSAAAADPWPNIATAEAAGGEIRREPAHPGGKAAGSRSKSRRRLWLVLGIACAITALARPRWGYHQEEEPEMAREILIAVDLSRSMLTADVAPSRLERAKLLIQSLLDQLSGERVGLMVFAGSAFLQAPLSSDYEVLREFLPQLNPDYLPDAGTDFGALLAAVPPAFSGGRTGDRFLVVLSDGGANDEGWKDNLDALKQQGIRVIALGIGTAAGGFIPDGSGGFMKDDRGAVVLARLEAPALRQLAAATGGVYRDASNWVDVAAVVRATVAAGREGRVASRRTGRPIERYQWPLAGALFCWLLSLWREFPVQPRVRALRWAAVAMLPLALTLAARGQPPEGALSSGEVLSRVVQRLSSSPRPPAALDWAEMAHDTLTWGHEISESGQLVPEGPVRDALRAVEDGRALGRNAADWATLEQELRSLLVPPPPKEKPPPQQQKQQQQNQKPSEQQPQPPPREQNADQRQQRSDSRASNPDLQPPPPAPPADAAAGNPALANPLEQLDRVRSGDSPATLFQMLQKQDPTQKPPAKNLKPW